MGEMLPEQDSAYIVQACNAHPKLVALAKKISESKPYDGEIGYCVLCFNDENDAHKNDCPVFEAAEILTSLGETE